MGSKNLFLALSSVADYIMGGPHGRRLKLSLFVGGGFQQPLESIACHGRQAME